MHLCNATTQRHRQVGGDAYPGFLAFDKVPPGADPALTGILPFVVVLTHCLQLDLLFRLILLTPCSVVFQLQR